MARERREAAPRDDEVPAPRGNADRSPLTPQALALDLPQDLAVERGANSDPEMTAGEESYAVVPFVVETCPRALSWSRSNSPLAPGDGKPKRPIDAREM